MKRLLHPIASFVSWHRRVIGALLAAASVLLIAQWLAEPAGPTVAAVVVRADVAAGHTLTPSDLEVRQLAPEAVPAGTFSGTDGAVGQVTAVGLRAGTPLQPGFIASGQSAEQGRAIVPVSISDSQLRALLRPGDAITLVMVGGESAEVLTSDARVAAMPQPAAESGFAVGSGSSGGLIMVDVPAAHAPAVAALGQGAQLSVVFGKI